MQPMRCFEKERMKKMSPMSTRTTTLLGKYRLMMSKGGPSPKGMGMMQIFVKSAERAASSTTATPKSFFEIQTNWTSFC
jgi:hypothetical protein